jgi:hypothetical protein
MAPQRLRRQRDPSIALQESSSEEGNLLHRVRSAASFLFFSQEDTGVTTYPSILIVNLILGLLQRIDTRWTASYKTTQTLGHSSAISLEYKTKEEKKRSELP